MGYNYLSFLVDLVGRVIGYFEVYRERLVGVEDFRGLFFYFVS